MQQLTKFWNTSTGKVAVLGGGMFGLLSLCSICAVCAFLLSWGNDSGEIANIESLSTNTPTIEPIIPLDSPSETSTQTPIPTNTPEPTATLVPPTDTPTPEPIATPTPKIVKPIVTANEGDVNIRSGPDTSYEKIGLLPLGESLEIIGRNDDSTWWQVSTPDDVGWLFADVTAADNVSDAIPIVEVPPLPEQEESVQENSIPANFQEAQVINVVDGDTIDVLINDVEYRVRYILVDTPETVHPTKPVESFGPEASEANRQFVEGKTVRLEKDVSETDQYGRLLRYVYVDDLMVNEELLRLGLAQVSTYPPDVKYVDRFLVVQQEAQNAGVGMWGNQPVVEQPAPVPATTGEGIIITDIFYDGVVKQVESDEYAEVTNQGTESLDMTGWRLNAGDDGQDFTFPQGFVMQPGQSCRIYTNEVHPETCGLSFNIGKAIWNNKGDEGYLYNAQGQLISEKTY